MDKQQMQKLLIPAAAIAGVILLVGLIIATGGSEKPNLGKRAPEPKAPPGVKMLGTGPMDATGMTTSLPPLDAPEWTDIGGGLKSWDVKVGDEEGVLETSDKVHCHYIGWRKDGVSFDGSVARGEPADFPLNGVIQGWTKGLPGMKPGGIRRLFIPAPLAYGTQQKGDKIPPNSDLVFEVKLLRIERKAN